MSAVVAGSPRFSVGAVRTGFDPARSVRGRRLRRSGQWRNCGFCTALVVPPLAAGQMTGVESVCVRPLTSTVQRWGPRPCMFMTSAARGAAAYGVDPRTPSPTYSVEPAAIEASRGRPRRGLRDPDSAPTRSAWAGWRRRGSSGPISAPSAVGGGRRLEAAGSPSESEISGDACVVRPADRPQRRDPVGPRTPQAH